MDAEKEEAVEAVTTPPPPLSSFAAADPDEPLELPLPPPPPPPPPKKLLKGVEAMKLDAADAGLASDVDANVDDAAVVAIDEDVDDDTAPDAAADDDEEIFGFDETEEEADVEFLVAAPVDDLLEVEAEATVVVDLTPEDAVVEGGGNVEEAVRSDFPPPEVGPVPEVAADADAGAENPGNLEVEKMFLDMLDIVCMSEGCSVIGGSAGVAEGGAFFLAYS